MSTSILLALTSLLPTTSPLPPELLSLSASLLAQSRTKAANLKPEEEIGRTYACCHVACERLGHRLGLELVAKPTPPVKPRVYAKLHAYFNSVLRTTAAGTGKERGRGGNEVLRGEGEATRGRNAGGQVTPVKAPGRTPPSSRKRAAAGQRGGNDDEFEVPDLVMPLVRHLCKDFDTREAAPHVFAGVRSVLKQQRLDVEADAISPPSAKKRRTGDRTSMSAETRRVLQDNSIPALVVALYIATTTRMYGREDQESSEQRDEVVETAKQYCDEREIAAGDNWHDKVEHFSTQAENDWDAMEWYQNVPEAATANNGGDEAGALEEEEDGDLNATPVKLPSKTPLRRKEKHGMVGQDDCVGAAGLLPGLGTMFQPAVDWLSDERRAEYARWRKEILRQVAVI